MCMMCYWILKLHNYVHKILTYLHAAFMRSFFRNDLSTKCNTVRRFADAICFARAKTYNFSINTINGHSVLFLITYLCHNILQF